MPALSCLQEEKHRSGLRSPLAFKALDIAFGGAEDKSQWANCWYIHCRLVFVVFLHFIGSPFLAWGKETTKSTYNYMACKKSISFFIKHLAFLPHIQERLLRAAYLWYWRRPVLHALPRLLSNPVGTKAGCRRSSQCATSRLHCRGEPTSRFIICRSFRFDNSNAAAFFDKKPVLSFWTQVFASLIGHSRCSPFFPTTGMSYLLRPERRGSSTLDSVIEALSKPPDIQLKVGSRYLVFLKWNSIEFTVSSLHHRPLGLAPYSIYLFLRGQLV